jgi:hypothetical protein
MARLSPCRGGWSGALMGLMTRVRVLPPATYEQVKASGGLRNSRPHRPITNGRRGWPCGVTGPSLEGTTTGEGGTQP